MVELPQSTAYTVYFKMYATGTSTEATSKTVAVTIMKTGATSFSNPAAGATNATECASGWYKVALGTGDVDTLGALSIRGTASSCDDYGYLFQIVKATNKGMTGIPDAAAGANTGLPVVGTQVPNATAAAVGGLLTAPTTANVGTVDLLRITGNTAGPTNLNTIFNTDYATVYDATNKGFNLTKVSSVTQTGIDIGAAVTNIGVTSAALNKVADSRTITTGTGEANTYTSTAAADGTYHSISDSAGAIDFYYEATLPTTGGALTGVNWLGYVVGVVNTIKVYIYNWTNSGWDQVGSVVGIAGTVNMDSDFDATNDHTGTGGNALKVRFRFSATGLTAATVKTDRLLFGYAVVPNTTTPPTVSAIATAIWQDATASDFTAASSIGKGLYTSGVAPGGSGGLFISGTNSGTTTVGALTVSGATTLTGAVSLGSTLSVTGATTFAGVSLTTFTASGAVAFQSTFAVTGTTTLTGAVSLGSTLGITGAVTLTDQLIIQNGVAITCTTTGRVAFKATGNGAGGHGIQGIGGTGSNTHGIYGLSGAGTTGSGITGLAQSTNGNGIIGTGTGTGNGMNLTAGSGGAGLKATGGSSGAGAIYLLATSNAGIYINPSGASVPGILVQSEADAINLQSAAGSGINISAVGATSPAIILTGGATSGNGITIITTDGDGIDLSGIAGAGQYGINGTINGAITSSGLSTLTQTQVTGGAYALNSASFAFNTAMDFTSTQKTSLNAATPASVVGAVGSVTGAVGSVTGNVGGNVVGSVASVTGNVGGNVTGSVGSIATGGIVAGSFGAGAIDAAAIATDALGSLELAAGAASEIATAVASQITTDHGSGSYLTATSVTVSDKTGFSLASTGLDAIATTAPSGVASTFREMVVQTWRRLFRKAVLNSTDGTIKTYADDGTTVVTTQATTDTAGTQTQGTAT